MPRIIKELTVQAPVATVWQLVSDMERFSACIPGCKEVRRLSDTEFDWVLEARVLRAPFYEMVEWAELRDGKLGVWSGGVWFELGAP